MKNTYTRPHGVTEKRRGRRRSIEGKVYMGVVSWILFWGQELARNRHLRWCLCHPGSHQTTWCHRRGVETWPYLQVANGESLSLFVSSARFLVFHFGEHRTRLLRYENNFFFRGLNINSGTFGLLED